MTFYLFVLDFKTDMPSAAAAAAAKRNNKTSTEWLKRYKRHKGGNMAPNRKKSRFLKLVVARAVDSWPIYPKLKPHLATILGNVAGALAPYIELDRVLKIARPFKDEQGDEKNGKEKNGKEKDGKEKDGKEKDGKEKDVEEKEKEKNPNQLAFETLLNVIQEPAIIARFVEDQKMLISKIVSNSETRIAFEELSKLDIVKKQKAAILETLEKRLKQNPILKSLDLNKSLDSLQGIFEFVSTIYDFNPLIFNTLVDQIPLKSAKGSDTQTPKSKLEMLFDNFKEQFFDADSQSPPNQNANSAQGPETLLQSPPNKNANSAQGPETLLQSPPNPNTKSKSVAKPKDDAKNKKKAHPPPDEIQNLVGALEHIDKVEKNTKTYATTCSILIPAISLVFSFFLTRYLYFKYAKESENKTLLLAIYSALVPISTCTILALFYTYSDYDFLLPIACIIATSWILAWLWIANFAFAPDSEISTDTFSKLFILQAVLTIPIYFIYSLNK
jgi:hypothetical protein